MKTGTLGGKLIYWDTEHIIRDMRRVRVNRPLSNAMRDPSSELPRVNVNTFRGVPQLLARFGVPVEPVLAVVGLTRQDLEDPERSAPYSDLDQLLGECVTRTQCAQFGLMLGQYADLTSFGVAGRLAQHAPSVGQGLSDLAAHFALHDSGGVPSIAIKDDIVTFAYCIHTTGLRHTDQIYDLSAVTGINIMRQLCGPEWNAGVVMLPRSRPRDIRPYQKIVNAPLLFDAACCAIRFPAHWLCHPVVDADPLLYTVLSERAAVSMSRQSPMFLGDVRRAIRLLLMAGGCSRAQLSAHLQIHSRTLSRRLQESGTTFQALIDEVRTQIAVQLLQDTRIPIARVAAAVGYQDAEVFIRAFRRWTGTTPPEYRSGLLRPQEPAPHDTTAS